MAGADFEAKALALLADIKADVAKVSERVAKVEVVHVERCGAQGKRLDDVEIEQERQSYISRLVKDGVLVEVEGKIDADAANKILDDRQAKAKPAKAKKSKGKLDGPHERARLAKAKADFQEIENAKASGLLVEKSGVREKIEQQYDAIRQKFLSMPNKIAPQVVGMDPKEAAGFIRAHIVEAFEELSSDAVLETEGDLDFLSRRASA